MFFLLLKSLILDSNGVYTCGIADFGRKGLYLKLKKICFNFFAAPHGTSTRSGLDLVRFPNCHNFRVAANIIHGLVLFVK